MVFRFRPVERVQPPASIPVRAPVEAPRSRTRAPSVETAQSIRTRPAPANESRTPVPPGPRTLSAGSVEGAAVTVHRVRLGPDVQKIRVARSAGVQVGNHNRQLNRYQFRMDRPQVSLDHLLEGHPAALRSFQKLVAHPYSLTANYAFRHHLPAGPARPGRGVLFADTSRAPTKRISTHVDEHGATVVENSRGIQVGDHNTMRNEFSYKLTGQELSLQRMLRGRPDLVRDLAMTVRHPGNPAVQRSFARRVSGAFNRGAAPSLSILNQDLPGSRVSVDGAFGVQAGIGNTRTDSVSIAIRRLALTGWDSIAATTGEPAPASQAIDGPSAVVTPAAPLVASPARAISWPAPTRRHPPDPVEDVADLGPSIGPAF